MEIMVDRVTGNAQNVLQAGAYQAMKESRKLIGDQAGKEIFGESLKRTGLEVALASSMQVSQDANQALAVATSKAFAGNVGMTFTSGYSEAVVETLKVNSAATVNEMVKAGLDGGTKAVVVDMVESATVDGINQAIKDSAAQLAKDSVTQTGKTASTAVSKTLFARIGAWWGRDAAAKAALKTSKALAKAAAKNSKTVIDEVAKSSTKGGLQEGAVETAKGGFFSWAGAGVFGADVSMPAPPTSSVLFMLPALPVNGSAHLQRVPGTDYSDSVRELLLDVLDPEVARSNNIDIDWSSLQPGQVYQLTFEPTHFAPSVLASAPFLGVFSNNNVEGEFDRCVQNVGGMMLLVLVLFHIIRRLSVLRITH